MKIFCAVLFGIGFLLCPWSGTAHAEAVSYEAPPIEGIELAPFLEIVDLPNTSESVNEFSSDIYECYFFEGEYYLCRGSTFRETDDPWEDFEKQLLAKSGLDSLPVHSYEELRALKPVGVYGDAENQKIGQILYRISDDLLLEADHFFQYSGLNGKITYTAAPEKIRYTLCARVPQESIRKNCWIEWRGDPHYAYAGADGRKVTGGKTIDGIRYVFDEYGYCQGKYTGFTKSSKGKRYWKNGTLVKNKWIRVNGERKYYAGANGYFVTETPETADSPKISVEFADGAVYESTDGGKSRTKDME